MEHNRRSYTVNTFRVCIDACREDISGRVYSPMCEGEVSFAGVGELLVKMDKLFDEVGFPQAFQDKRSFGTGQDRSNVYRRIPKIKRNAEKIWDQTGKCRTFDIVVESRRNTSWQGSIFDPSGKECGKFNGEVELLVRLTRLAEI